MENTFSFSIEAFSILLTALITYYFALRQNAAAKQQEIVKEQKYQYFLPFKYQSEELLNRVIHIEHRLSEEQKEMKGHFALSLEGKDLEWYFKDWEDVSKLISGGYFLTSTIYMHCLVYNKMYALQQKFPYIEVKIKNSLEELAVKDDRIKRYMGDKQKGGVQINEENEFVTWIRLKGIIDFKKAVHAVRVSTIMRLNEGIPYALHYSLGDFVSDGKGGIINYEKFCLMLADSAQRVKFSPLINFWSGMVDEDKNLNPKRLEKLRTLIIALKLVQSCDLK